MIRVYLKDSNNLVYVNDLYDVLNEESVNTATVQVTIYDSDGDEVSGTIWPRTLQYIPGSQGDYVETLDDEIGLELGLFYTAKLIIDDGTGRHLEEVHELEIVDRQP